ncbi:MAG: recombinase family protein [Dehalococcoidales bacterium]|nr:recombinase family protein [Dehalococcoidales bacterium]
MDNTFNPTNVLAYFDGLTFSRCDRLSRRFDAALQIALDCKKSGLAIRFVRENQWLRPDDEPLQFVMFVLQAFGVHTQTGIAIANMNAGRLRAAAEGKPAGRSWQRDAGLHPGREEVHHQLIYRRSR